MSRETIEDALRRAYRKYRDAVEKGYAEEQCRQLGNIKVWKQALIERYGYTGEEVQALIANEGTRKAG